MPFRFPDDTQRLTIMGKTGEGKTLAAAWHLANRRFDLRPWVIVDFKRDKLLNSIGAQEWTLKKPPSKPGLYIVHPQQSEAKDLEAFMWQMWKQENIGLYIDEGYMIDRASEAFQAILTQGRSKHVPVICLSQRPVWLSRFVVSEADFLQVFWLNDYRDRQTVQSFVPFSMEERLPRFHSRYYDVGQDQHFVLRPVPNESKLRAMFRDRLTPKRRAL